MTIAYIFISGYKAKASDIRLTDGTVTGVVNKPITGVINNSVYLPATRDLLSLELMPEEFNETADAMVRSLTLFLLPSEFDAIHTGDYSRIIPRTNGTPDRLVLVSDAPLFFAYEPRDL